MRRHSMHDIVGSRSARPERALSFAAIVAVISACVVAPTAAVRADDAATQTDGDAAQSAPAPAAPARASVHVTTAGTLDHRVKVLTKALDLDARQQVELRRIFESQRTAVKSVWSNPALLPAERVPATHAIENRTADQIRGILNDEQKKKYNPPKPPPAPTAESGAPDVGAWMEKTRAKH